MKKNALFLSNEIYFDASKNEGGVKVCSEEYLNLIRELYSVTLFIVKNRDSIIYRVLVKLGLNVYNDYITERYILSLGEVIKNNKIEIVFLNLSNTAPFAQSIKQSIGSHIQIIICSHGNESGDFLHVNTRFRFHIPFYRLFFSNFVLGKMLVLEALSRQKYIDAVLTVSDIEVAIEKWVGAKNVYLVPRTISINNLEHKPRLGRVGFLGDLSHAPNFYGISKVCEELNRMPDIMNFEVILVGSSPLYGSQLANRYPFVKYMGYMHNTELELEVSTWAFFLNPVFYYSRGVSTKLAKALSWGIPVLSTSIGCRGYKWRSGSIILAETPLEMATSIYNLAFDSKEIKTAQVEIMNLANSTLSIKDIASDISQFLKKIR